MAGTIAPLERLASLLDPPRQRNSSPEDIKRRRRLAEALSQQATDPAGGGGSMLGAIGQGLKGFVAARMQDQAGKDEADGIAAMNAALGRVSTGAPQGAASGTAPASAMMRAGMGLPAQSDGASGPGRTTPDAVYSGLVARGIPSIVAAGMVGNIAGESNFQLGVADGRGEGSVGLIQARGPRLASLKELGASTGRDPFSLDNQLDHIAQEFQGPEKKAFQLAQGAKTPGEAAFILAKHYERPADWALRESAPKRMGAAERVYQQFGQQAAADPSSFMSAEPARTGQVADPRSLAMAEPARPGAVQDPAGLATPMADMPVQGAQPASFLTGERDPNGGFFIPPGVRATAPPGDPSGPRPGDAPMPQPAPDVAALFSPQAMGGAQSFVPPAAATQAAPMPLPPARPPAEELLAPAPAPAPQAQAAPPQLPGPAPQALAPQTVPLPPARPSDAALYAPSPADMPAPGAVPAAGMMPINPNAQDAGAPAFARRQGIDVMLGGLQDGLDRVFGGPETQARLDRQVQALGGAPQASPRTQRLADALAPASAPAQTGPQAPAGMPVPSPMGAGMDRRQALATALDPASAQQPVAQNQPQAGGGLPDARRQDLLALANSEYATPQIRQYAVDQLNPKLNHVDMGDSIGFVDQGGALIRSYPKTKAADFGEVGRNAYGDPIMGYRDYSQRSVSVPQVPGAAGAQAPVDMNGRPIPQGVDPKLVRAEQSKSYAEGTVPASSASVAELRKEVAQRPEFKNYAQAAPIYRSMVATAGTNTKASDLNLIYGLGKIMDPGSVVREGEMVMANNTQGIQERLNGMISSLQGGAMLTPQSRQALMAEAYGRMQSYETEFGAARAHYTDIAKRNRMNPDDVVQGFEPAKPWQAEAAGGSAPSAAVQALRSDPRLQEQFEAKYGKGSAARALGGR